MSTPTEQPAATPQPRRTRIESLLLLSAGALLACTAWAWLNGPIGAFRGTPALADVALAGPDQTVITSDGGGDDILVVLDQRNEELLLYRPMNGKTLDFRGRFQLRPLFAEARANGAIVPMPEPEKVPGATPTPPPTDNPPR